MAFFTSGTSALIATYFLSFATIKGIDDHRGLMLPWNPFHMLFGSNTAYHDIHHQLAGSKFNFSQPFFVMWDKILGTYAPYTIERRAGGMEPGSDSLEAVGEKLTGFMRGLGTEPREKIGSLGSSRGPEQRKPGARWGPEQRKPGAFFLLGPWSLLSAVIPGRRAGAEGLHLGSGARSLGPGGWTMEEGAGNLYAL